MKINFKNINLFDSFAIIFILGIICLFLIPIIIPSNYNEQRVEITISVTENYELVADEVIKQKGQEIFLNGIEQPAILEDVIIKDQTLYMYCSSEGEIKNPVYIFGGKRILIGQKAEIHSSFFARGIITEIEYED